MKIIIDKQRDYKLISKVFSRSVATELAKRQESCTLKQIFSELGFPQDFLSKRPLAEMFQDMFDTLLHGYRNEYVYKNAIATKILRARHKLSNASYVNEFRVGQSIADVAIFNGTSTAYEIKSEYDSFDRLDSQVAAYSKVFEYVYVVVPQCKIEALLATVPSQIGIYILTKEYTLREFRKAGSNINNLCKVSMIHCLRPSEYQEIITSRFGQISSERPGQVRDECIKKFSTLNNKAAHGEMIRVLRGRELQDFEKKVINSLPKSLTSMALTMRFNKKQLHSFYSCVMAPDVPKSNNNRSFYVPLIPQRETV